MRISQNTMALISHPRSHANCRIYASDISTNFHMSTLYGLRSKNWRKPSIILRASKPGTLYSITTKLTLIPPIEDAQAPICKEFIAFSEEIGPPAPQPLEFSTTLFMVGRSTSFTMGLYGGMAETATRSWKADQGGTLHMAGHYKKIHYYTPIEGLYGRFSNFFGRAGDSGAAVIDWFGLSVGLYFAGNDYAGVGYFFAADKLFADIKHISKASDIQVLWSCWLQ